jgi:hypothetical protein
MVAQQPKFRDFIDFLAKATQVEKKKCKAEDIAENLANEIEK